MRKTCEECKINAVYQRFLGLSMHKDMLNYSTWTQKHIRRYKEIVKYLVNI